MKLFKKMLGVTLLEIMLVLAIAAMIIVMSVRYYQSATASSQANTALSQVQAIMAAADGLSQAGGSYSAAITSNAAITPLLPTNGLVMPWNETVTVVGTGATTYTIAFATIPKGVCPLLNTRMITNTRFTTTGNCNATGSAAITYTYTSTS